MSKHDHQQEPESPISFRVSVSRLPQKGMPVAIDADAAQRAALAAEHGVGEVKSLHADLLVAPWKRNGVRVSGTVEAAVVQLCVVTLDPVDNVIDEEIDQLYLPRDSKLGRLGFESGGEILLDAEGDDSPETFTGDTIDVGALVEEHFGLGIDPYPRKPGVELEQEADDLEDEEAHPLAAKLGSLLRKP